MIFEFHVTNIINWGAKATSNKVFKDACQGTPWLLNLDQDCWFDPNL